MYKVFVVLVKSLSLIGPLVRLTVFMGRQTFAFSESALLINARYMSLRLFSSLLTLEFVAIGRVE